jgi:hypothetical protein
MCVAVVSVEIARKICKWLSLAIADSYIKPEGYNNNNNFWRYILYPSQRVMA